jgi:hypothetical protein
VDPQSPEGERLRACWMDGKRPERYFVPYTWVDASRAHGRELKQIFIDDKGDPLLICIHHSIANVNVRDALRLRVIVCLFRLQMSHPNTPHVALWRRSDGRTGGCCHHSCGPRHTGVPAARTTVQKHQADRVVPLGQAKHRPWGRQLQYSYLQGPGWSPPWRRVHSLSWRATFVCSYTIAVAECSARKTKRTYVSGWPRRDLTKRTEAVRATSSTRN